MAYTCFVESFTYDSKKRNRPIRVTGDVPTIPARAQVREDIMPLALHRGALDFDILPHNTVRGHLIGLDSLGGAEDPNNLVPMYGAFNLSTYKTKFENVLKSNVQRQSVKSASVDLQIKYGGDKTDQRIPVSFSYVLTISNLDGSSGMFKDDISHPAPQAAFVPHDNKAAEYLAAMDKEMKTAKWWVEDHVRNRALATKHFEHDKALVVPAKDYAQRPYAVLDYILYGKRDFSVVNGNCAPEIINGLDFTQSQIDVILATNVARNAGYYKSDDANDYVYQGKAALFSNPEHVKYYYLHAHSAGGSIDGVLLMSGYHQKPEVDHIIMKRKHLDPGCNAYSNARVVSRYLNSEDRGRPTQ